MDPGVDELQKHDLIAPGLSNGRPVVPICRLQPAPWADQIRSASIVSTVKINQAGFTEMMDTE